MFVVVSADRDAVLALAFPSITKLPDCSPANLTIGNGSFTATYQRTSAFTEADQSYAVIATIFVEGQCPAHFLRVAAKNGILFVQATMPLADPADYPDEANRPGISKASDPDDGGSFPPSSVTDSQLPLEMQESIRELGVSVHVAPLADR